MVTISQKTIEQFLALQRSEEKFRILFEKSPIGMVLVDNTTGKFLEANAAILQLLGYSESELQALTFWDLTPKIYQDQELMQQQELKDKGSFGPNEKEYIRKDGTCSPIKIRGFLLTNFEGQEVAWRLVEDISQQKEAEETIRHLAFHDPLTGLPNRRLLSDRVQQALINAQRNQTTGALFICDLDRFKPVNDSYGHDVGDLLLIEVAKRITQKVLHRKSDTFSRIGGDEFAILLPDISSVSGATDIAQNMLNQLRKPFYIAEYEINIACSIGIALFPEHGNDEISLTRIADVAMYKVKVNGGDGWQIGSV